MAGFLRFVGAVFKTFQRVKGFCRREIFSVIHQLLCSLIVLRHLLQLAGFLRLVGAVVIAFQRVKGFCRRKVLAIGHQLLCGLIVLRRLLQLASLLRLVRTVVIAFQRVEGFRRRGIFFFVQQTLCFQICCLFCVVRCRHCLSYPQRTAAEQQNAHRDPHPFVGFLFFRRGSKAASASFCGIGIQGAGLLVLTGVMKTPVSAVCIARGRFVRRDGFICICRNGYVRGFPGAALLVARVQIPPQFLDSLVTLIRGESAGFHNDRL